MEGTPRTDTAMLTFKGDSSSSVLAEALGVRTGRRHVALHLYMVSQYPAMICGLNTTTANEAGGVLEKRRIFFQSGAAITITMRFS